MEIPNAKEDKITKLYVPVEEFKFHGPLEVDTSNGLFLNDVYFPEEIIMKVLTFLPARLLLRLSLVCKKWCNIIKSTSLWMDVYNNQFPNKAKRLPWYVYYLYFSTLNFKNLIKIGNAQHEFNQWTRLTNFGDVENVFIKIQVIGLEHKRLLRYVINTFKPHIYVSEWYTGFLERRHKYKVTIKGFSYESTQEPVGEFTADDNNDEIVFLSDLKPVLIEQCRGRKWNKMETIVEEYDKSLRTLVFQHESINKQFWSGHYRSKRAVVQFVFESMQPIEEHNEEPCD
ncbi:F-box only protein 44-like [Diabrotica undecimpunctata]|uniref:F-box only protein 44-like n=1 Tax=Diabrotica undecimpunctata TaxID=50387 RepID=UPI003B63AE19